MVLLAPEFPTPVQDAVAAMCEAWWHADKPGREELVTKTAPYLVLLALGTGQGLGLTLVHFSAQRRHFLWYRGCV
jgi:hypothetical protein